MSCNPGYFEKRMRGAKVHKNAAPPSSQYSSERQSSLFSVAHRARAKSPRRLHVPHSLWLFLSYHSSEGDYPLLLNGAWECFSNCIVRHPYEVFVISLRMFFCVANENRDQLGSPWVLSGRHTPNIGFLVLAFTEVNKSCIAPNAPQQLPLSKSKEELFSHRSPWHS